jgi:universal stress protein A
VSIKKILCPVDFSQSSARALAFAERLALGLSAEIVLLHVSSTTHDYTVAGRTFPADTEAQQRLENLRPAAAVPVQRVLHGGEPGKVICWLAENQNCDLIVLGTHGRQGLAHLLLGSVAEYVMRHACCPVLTVRLVPEKEQPLKEPLDLPVPAPRFM